MLIRRPEQHRNRTVNGSRVWRKFKCVTILLKCSLCIVRIHIRLGQVQVTIHPSRAGLKVGSEKVELNIQDWGGFIGQWDDRQWTSKDTSHDDYGEMTGIKPGYIKRADLAWYCSHHHNAEGENVPYRYSYLFAYLIDLPAGTNTINLPDNDKIRVLAVSVADENPEVKPAQPLYDLLGPPPARRE